ncbi:putative DNA-binding domain-containing protein [Kitasatospora sp. NPDC017646]|uniref:HvfC/BufC family peptide modification chaperone n=1 Tax=Kitasatospora sp. NPDC017646 TaxID=3364024 RepID=UPI0037A8995C
MRSNARTHGAVDRANAVPPADLVGLQLWLRKAIVCPDRGVVDDVPAVLTCSARQTAAERLAVYQRAYRLRLLGCLHASFPALRHLLGHQAFDVLAEEYLDAVPPSSYTLDHFVQGFPVHLAEDRPDADDPVDERDPWVDLVVELACYERAFAEVYDAAEPDPRRVLRCRHPVHTYVHAVARGRDPVPPPARPVLLTLRRLGHRVAVSEESLLVTNPLDTQPHPAHAPTPA